MTNQSHTELATQVREQARELAKYQSIDFDGDFQAAINTLRQCAAALESPERVLGEAQYPLPDELYESKDWKAAGYAGRVEWLHAMYEAKKKELDSFLSMATQATAPAQDAQGDGASALQLADLVLSMPMVSEKGQRAKELARQVQEKYHESPAELVLRDLASWLGIGGYNDPYINAEKYKAKIIKEIESLTATPSPQAEKQPLSEADEALIRQALDALESLRIDLRYGMTGHEINAITALRARLESSNVPT